MKQGWEAARDRGWVGAPWWAVRSLWRETGWDASEAGDSKSTLRDRALGPS